MNTPKIVCPVCKSRIDTEDISSRCPICNTNLSTSDEQLLYSEQDCEFRIEDFREQRGTLYLTNQRLFFMIEQSSGSILDGTVKAIYEAATNARCNVELGFTFSFDEIESVKEGKYSWFSKGICIDTTEYAVHKIWVAQRKEWLARIVQAIYAK